MLTSCCATTRAGVIERALHLGSLRWSLDDKALRTALSQRNGHEYQRLSELEQFDSLARGGHQSDPSDAERSAGSGSIRRSCTWTFALYVIGTNSTSKSHDWLVCTQ